MITRAFTAILAFAWLCAADDADASREELIDALVDEVTAMIPDAEEEDDWADAAAADEPEDDAAAEECSPVESLLQELLELGESAN